MPESALLTTQKPQAGDCTYTQSSPCQKVLVNLIFSQTRSIDSDRQSQVSSQLLNTHTTREETEQSDRALDDSLGTGKNHAPNVERTTLPHFPDTCCPKSQEPNGSLAPQTTLS